MKPRLGATGAESVNSSDAKIYQTGVFSYIFCCCSIGWEITIKTSNGIFNCFNKPVKICVYKKQTILWYLKVKLQCTVAAQNVEEFGNFEAKYTAYLIGFWTNMSAGAGAM